MAMNNTTGKLEKLLVELVRLLSEAHYQLYDLQEGLMPEFSQGGDEEHPSFELTDDISAVLASLKEVPMNRGDDMATKFSTKNGTGEGYWCDACHTCESCQGNGWVLSNNEAGYKDLQKCDACRVFQWDEDAKKSALEYIKDIQDYITNTGFHEEA